MLLGGRSPGVLAVRPRHEAAGAQRQLLGAVALRARAQRARADGGHREEPLHPPGPRRQLQVQSPTSSPRHWMSRRQSGLV